MREEAEGLRLLGGTAYTIPELHTTKNTINKPTIALIFGSGTLLQRAVS